MNDTIAGLVRLQEFDRVLESLRQRVGKTAPRRADIAASRAASAARTDASKKHLLDAQLARKSKEAEIDAKDALVRKHSSELGGVKSNDAYKALLNEIESAKSEKTGLEDQVLVLMEQIESLQKAAKEAEGDAQKAKIELDGQERALDAEEVWLKSEWDEKKKERETFFSGLSAEGRGRYESIQRGRQGFEVVVPVRDMTCGGCRQRLPPQVVNQVMKGKELITCESCSRILYIPAPPPAQDGTETTSATSGEVAAPLPRPSV